MHVGIGNRWIAESLGRDKRNGHYFAFPTVGEGVTVKVSGESAEDVAEVANRIERACKDRA